MKTFVFTVERLIRKRNNIKLRIYSVNKNLPKYLGSLEYTTGVSTSRDEVFKWLIKFGFIPKKYNNLGARFYGMPEGFYPPNLADYGYNIIELFQ
jgi:hypothetical protein